MREDIPPLAELRDFMKPRAHARHSFDEGQALQVVQRIAESLLAQEYDVKIIFKEQVNSL